MRQYEDQATRDYAAYEFGQVALIACAMVDRSDAEVPDARDR